MRPLFHPSIEEVTVEGVLHALSDRTRLTLFAALVGANGAPSCSNLLALAGDGQQSIPKSTLSQHFKVLRESGLIRSVRRGVEMQNSSRCVEINERFPGLIPAVLGAYAQERAPAAKKGKKG